MRALIGGVGGGGEGSVCPLSEFQNTFFFRILKRKPCPSRYFTIYAFLHFCHFSIKALRVISVKFLLTAFNITALQNTVVMRIEDMITQDESSNFPHYFY